MDLFETLASSTKPSALDMESARIVVMSHLSDAQEDSKIANERINFAKYVILHCGGDLTQQINPNELWRKFKSKY